VLFFFFFKSQQHLLHRAKLKQQILTVDNGNLEFIGKKWNLEDEGV